MTPLKHVGAGVGSGVELPEADTTAGDCDAVGEELAVTEGEAPTDSEAVGEELGVEVAVAVLEGVPVDVTLTVEVVEGEAPVDSEGVGVELGVVVTDTVLEGVAVGDRDVDGEAEAVSLAVEVVDGSAPVDSEGVGEELGVAVNDAVLEGEEEGVMEGDGVIVEPSHCEFVAALHVIAASVQLQPTRVDTEEAGHEPGHAVSTAPLAGEDADAYVPDAHGAHTTSAVELPATA